MNKTTLSSKAIGTLFKLDYCKDKSLNCDFNLQVTFIKQIIQNNNNLQGKLSYQMTLSDNELECKQFILVVDKECEVQQYDVVNIKKILVNVKQKSDQEIMVTFIIWSSF